MEGESLPDLLLDYETMALMGIWVNPVTWEASYLEHMSHCFDEGLMRA